MDGNRLAQRGVVQLRDTAWIARANGCVVFDAGGWLSISHVIQKSHRATTLLVLTVLGRL